MKIKDLAGILSFYQETVENIGYAEAAIHNMMPNDTHGWGDIVDKAEKLLPIYKEVLKYLDSLDSNESLTLGEIKKHCESLINEEF